MKVGVPKEIAEGENRVGLVPETVGKLVKDGFEVLVETGGFVSTEGVDERAKVILDVKCPASGEAERNHWPNLERIRADRDEIKFVVADAADWDYAAEVISRYDLTRRARAVLVSPVWGVTDLAALAAWITESGLDVRLQVQLHKLICGAEARGV